MPPFLTLFANSVNKSLNGQRIIFLNLKLRAADRNRQEFQGGLIVNGWMMHAGEGRATNLYLAVNYALQIKLH